MKQVLIVEDAEKTRAWLAGMVRETFPGCTVTEAPDQREGVRLANSSGFDLALIDLGLPDGSGFDVLRCLRAQSPAPLCVIVTVLGDDAQIVAALSAGAGGYLLKEHLPETLKRHLLQLADGVPALSPSIARRIMEHFRLTGPATNCDSSLSAREKNVLGLISRGLRNCDVAESLGIAESTVATHIKAIYRKLGISTRAEASWHATRLGL